MIVVCVEKIKQQFGMFSYVSLNERVPAEHPLRAIRKTMDEILRGMAKEFDALYAKTGRPSVPPERLLRALLLQIFYSVRSERLLMEQLAYNLLSVGLWGWRWTSRFGIMRCSARTANGC